MFSYEPNGQDRGGLDTTSDPQARAEAEFQLNRMYAYLDAAVAVHQKGVVRERAKNDYARFYAAAVLHFIDRRFDVGPAGTVREPEYRFDSVGTKVYAAYQMFDDGRKPNSPLSASDHDYQGVLDGNKRFEQQLVQEVSMTPEFDEIYTSIADAIVATIVGENRDGHGIKREEIEPPDSSEELLAALSSAERAQLQDLIVNGLKKSSLDLSNLLSHPYFRGESQDLHIGDCLSPAQLQTLLDELSASPENNSGGRFNRIMLILRKVFASLEEKTGRTLSHDVRSTLQQTAKNIASRAQDVVVVMSPAIDQVVAAAKDQDLDGLSPTQVRLVYAITSLPLLHQATEKINGYFDELKKKPNDPSLDNHLLIHEVVRLLMEAEHLGENMKQKVNRLLSRSTAIDYDVRQFIMAQLDLVDLQNSSFDNRIFVDLLSPLRQLVVVGSEDVVERLTFLRSELETKIETIQAFVDDSSGVNSDLAGLEPDIRQALLALVGEMQAALQEMAKLEGLEKIIANNEAERSLRAETVRETTLRLIQQQIGQTGHLDLESLVAQVVAEISRNEGEANEKALQHLTQQASGGDLDDLIDSKGRIKKAKTSDS